MKNIFKYITFVFASIVLSCSNDDEGNSTTPPDNEFIGQIDWTKTFGGTQEETAQNIVVTPDGGYALVGYTKSINGDITDHTAEENNYWVLRLDANGTVLWSKTYGGTSDDRAESIATTSDGGFVISGYSRSNDEDVTENQGFYDQWIVKIDASGNIQWQKSLGFSGNDQSYAVIQTTDGGYFATGFLDVSASGGAGDFGRSAISSATLHGVGEFWCHKLDASGNRIWSRYFGGSNNDRSYDVLETNDGNFLLVGSSESDDFDISNSKGSYDFWVLKISASGDLIWENSYGGSGIDIGYAATKSHDGNYIIVGDTRSTDGDVSNFYGVADFWVIKVSDTDGSLIWEKSYGGDDFDSARAITQTQNGGYAIVGSSKSATNDVDENYGQNDIWVITINESGSITWEKNIGGSAFDFASGIKETMLQELIITGNTESSDTDVSEFKGIKDAIVIKIK